VRVNAIPPPLVIPATRTPHASIAAPFVLIREWWWDRDRRRHVTAMLARDHQTDAVASRLAPMALQLAEIWALPEVFEPTRQ
jgi:hypothetical protein